MIKPVKLTKSQYTDIQEVHAQAHLVNFARFKAGPQNHIGTKMWQGRHFALFWVTSQSSSSSLININQHVKHSINTVYCPTAVLGSYIQANFPALFSQHFF